MITEHDLQEAIAECEGKRNPDAKTCIMLAAFYTIRRELFGNPEQLTKQPDFSLIGDRSFEKPDDYSYAPPPDQFETAIDYSSDTEFGRIIHGRRAAEVWPIIDELVSEPVFALIPRAYDALIRKLK